jgi:hypothetical protein
LERSFTEIVRRHEALRTRFETVEGAAVQVIDEAAEVELRRVDLRGRPEVELEARRERKQRGSGRLICRRGRCCEFCCCSWRMKSRCWW